MIQSLSRHDQLVAMELLLQPITSGPEPVEPPAWHREILEERTRRVESGEVELLDWDDVKLRLRKHNG